MVLSQVLHTICHMDAVLNDPGEFCRKNQKYKGRVRIADLERLSIISANQSGELSWVTEGKISPLGFSQLDLSVKGQVDLKCQRCLDTFAFDLDSQTSILLAKNEEEADEIEDMLSEDDPTEVIVGAEKVDMMILIEDEVLLTIPLSPRHDICPDNSQLVFSKKPESPFSVLKELKTGKEKKN